MMSAPRSIRKRLRDAAAEEDVEEIKRLHRLDMAGKLDYAAALSVAFKCGSIIVAEHLWTCMDVCLEVVDSDDEEEEEEDKNAGSEQVLARRALEAAYPGFVCQLARHAPMTILDALTSDLYGACTWYPILLNWCKSIKRNTGSIRNSERTYWNVRYTWLLQ
jgi:hypothetical protein